MADDQPSRILAVILGASVFPDSPKLAERRSFYISAADVKDYLSAERGLAIPKLNIFSLFDDSRSPADQLTEIAKFLSRRLGELGSQGTPAETLLFYYVGHGLFTRGDQKYCLAVRSTNEINESASSLRASDLASVIKERAAFVRRYLILDCCFSASVYKEFQSGPLNAARIQIEHELPERGTALLCSSSAREPSLAPEGLVHTMFSDALIKALRRGHSGCGQKFSFSELGALVEENLRNEYPENWVRPEVLSPDQRAGNIADIPLFPNPAYVSARDAAKREAEQARMAREKAKAAERVRLDREKAAQGRQPQAREQAAAAEQLRREAAARAQQTSSNAPTLVTQPPFCEKCGREIPAGSLGCPYCATGPLPSLLDEPQARKALRYGLVAIGLLLAVAIVGLFYFPFALTGPSVRPNALLTEGDRKDGIESLCKVFQIYGLPKNGLHATEAAHNAGELFKLAGNQSPERSEYILKMLAKEFLVGHLGRADCSAAGAPLPTEGN